MSEWVSCKLQDVIDIRHGYAFKGEYITNEETSNLLLTPGNFNIGGGFKSDSFKYYSGDVPIEYVLNAGDVIITMTDLSKSIDTLGYSAVIPIIRNKKLLHNQRLGKIIFKSDNIHPLFIYWLLRTQEYRWHIIGTATGTTVSHTSPSRILSYQFFCPPLPEQRAIAGVLSSLDDKIDLLHRQNKTLEAMAETIWRKMFIENAKPEWDEVSLLELVDLVGGGTPKTTIEEYWDGKIPWLSATDVSENNRSYIIQPEKRITEEGLKNSTTKLLPPNATVITARGSVGNYCILSKAMTFSQSNYGILPKFKKCFYYSYLLIGYLVDELIASSYGTIFDTITTNTFKNVVVKKPEQHTVELFEAEISPLFNKMALIGTQIHSLTHLRNSLLPKLMTGKVRVKYENN